MNAIQPCHDSAGVSLRQAALIAGVGLLVMSIAAPFAEFLVYAKLIEPGDIGTTLENIRAGGGLYLAGVFAYLVVFIFDVIVAWALYVLLIPVSRSLSLLTAWFRLIYTAIALFAMLKLVTLYRLLHSADAVVTSAAGAFHVQADLLLQAFRYEWGFGLILFGIHLLLLGFLVYRSGYIPRFLGILLGIAGASWIVYELSPFLWPGADLGFLMIVFAFELVFMAWLLIRGRAIRETPR